MTKPELPTSCSATRSLWIEERNKLIEEWVHLWTTFHDRKLEAAEKQAQQLIEKEIQYQQEIVTREMQIKERQESIQTLESQKQDLETARMSQQVQWELAQKDLEVAMAKSKHLESVVNQMHQVVEEANVLSARAERLRSELSTCTFQLTRKEEELEQLKLLQEEEVAQLREDVFRFENECIASKKKLEAFYTHIKALENELQRTRDLWTESDKKAQHFSVSYDKLYEKHSALEKETKERERENRTLENKNSLFERKVEDMCRVKTENDTLHSKVNTLEAKNRQQDTLPDRIHQGQFWTLGGTPDEQDEN